VNHNSAGFQMPSTSWSVIVQAGNPESPDAREALSKLCEVYWHPIYSLIRRKGKSPEETSDLTQSFFVHVLEKGTIALAKRDRGRFRDFLKKVCEHFLIDGYRRQNAEARDGRVTIVSIDVLDAEGRYRFEPSDHRTPEQLFELDWALTLLARVLDRLALEYAGRGKSDLFEYLKIVLTEGRGAVPYALIAEKLDMKRNAVDQASKRFRDRHREILLEEIAVTLDDPAEIDDEIQKLIAAVSA
jgi:RNA polymerase sigma factor (sigma-70 family)